ncbi:uncharacterized protein B0P05DRAFT_469544 [Gilbertella persicaria]|uniref:uncharacterized protein n=1 Tax=Gilbertella persicaria TaxID=101096 RepID=UPI002220D995|nr:uncharacterized protein B0P05DRAFT_469544 [Gilbertella persicaria]KAI8080237.1 hypothetical protein B0P05DRAFT_469544 [Gilbertella persicaria]
MAKKRNTNDKTEEKPRTIYDDIESLQVTFYEIESWIEKTSPLLNRISKDLDKASTHFVKHKKESPEEQTRQLEQHLFQLQQKNSSTNNTMQWLLSFQPGNMLRLDTNITSVEQLIQAVQQIRLLQAGDPTPQASSTTSTSITLTDEDDTILELLCSSPSPSYDLPQDASSLEFWHNVIGRRPEIYLENYNHCRMNLNGLTKNISPAGMNYIGQVFWDCLHPKFSSNWHSFWERSGDPKRNQVCTDAGLAMMFLHVMRHDKYICENAQEIAGFYYDRARNELMESFDEPPDHSTMEALLTMSMFCIICKRYSQARIYIGLSLHVAFEWGIHRIANLPTDDLALRKQYLKMFLILCYNDCTLSCHTSEASIINESEVDINLYEIITLNQQLHDPQQVCDFEYNKMIVKDTYFVYAVELFRFYNKCVKLTERGASIKQLLAEEEHLKQWNQCISEAFRIDDHDYERLEQLKLNRERQHDITATMDADALQAHAALLLKIQCETTWIVLHKAVLSSIRRSRSKSPPSYYLSEQEKRSSTVCTNAADAVIEVCEVLTRCFGWCVFQLTPNCLYHASTVYCGNALIKEDVTLRSKAQKMIYRLMRILKISSLIYKGFPDDLTASLCEFLKMQDLHNEIECPCHDTL